MDNKLAFWGNKLCWTVDPTFGCTIEGVIVFPVSGEVSVYPGDSSSGGSEDVGGVDGLSSTKPLSSISVRVHPHELTKRSFKNL